MATRGKRLPPLSAQIDALLAKREEQRAAQAHADELKEKMAPLEEALLERLNAEGLTQAAGSKATIYVKKTEEPDVKDWQAVYGYVAKHGAWEILQKRISSTAWRERREEGDEVPGIDVFIRQKLNLRTKE